MGLYSLQGCQKFFEQRADNQQQAALELATKAQVLEGRGVQVHFDIQTLRNGISRGFKNYFSLRTPYCLVIMHAGLGTMPLICPRCSTTSHGLNVLLIQTCLNMHSLSFKTGKRMLYNFIRWCLFFVRSYGRRR